MFHLKIVITQCAIKLYFLKYNMQKLYNNTTGFGTGTLNTATPTSVAGHDLEVVSRPNPSLPCTLSPKNPFSCRPPKFCFRVRKWTYSKGVLCKTLHEFPPSSHPRA